ncbi:MAG: PfkB family carbohydrate kinase [Anaerolineae bacterium]
MSTKAAFKRWDVLGLGSSTVDDFLYVPIYPQPDTKMEVEDSQRYGGGLTATALVAAARLGARAAFGGLLGDDEISRWVETDLQREGVDTSLVVRHPDARPIHAVIVVEETHQTRTILYSLKGQVGADDTRPAADVIRSSGVLFIDDFGIPGQIRAATIAREAGIPVVGDFEREASPRIPELIDLVDHLILSIGFTERYTHIREPEAALRHLWNETRAVVVLTAGTHGCWYSTDGRQVQHQPAFAVKAVDTTGCGDVFHGAYAAALNWDMSTAERIRFASAAAALKATQPGGRRGIPTRDMTEAFLKTAT